MPRSNPTPPTLTPDSTGRGMLWTRVRGPSQPCMWGPRARTAVLAGRGPGTQSTKDARCKWPAGGFHARHAHRPYRGNQKQSLPHRDRKSPPPRALLTTPTPTLVGGSVKSTGPGPSDLRNSRSRGHVTRSAQRTPGSHCKTPGLSGIGGVLSSYLGMLSGHRIGLLG